MAVQFDITVSELRELMEHRGVEALELIADKHGGVINLCKKLKTSPTQGEHEFCQFYAFCVCVCAYLCAYKHVIMCVTVELIFSLSQTHSQRL